eukprot:Awhi_evm1s11400
MKVNLTTESNSLFVEPSSLLKQINTDPYHRRRKSNTSDAASNKNDNNDGIENNANTPIRKSARL